MAKNFGPGILGSVVLIDPETGLPYKAEAAADPAALDATVAVAVNDPESLTGAALSATYVRPLGTSDLTKVIAIGSSNVAGYTLKGPATESWVSLVAARLSATHEFVNLGVAGKSPEDWVAPDETTGLSELDVILLDERPHVVVAGFAQQNCGGPGPRIVAAIERARAICESRGVRFVACTPYNSESYTTAQIDGTRWVVETLKSRGVALLNVGSLWGEPLMPDSIDSGDGLHLNAAGHVAEASMVPSDMLATDCALSPIRLPQSGGTVMPTVTASTEMLTLSPAAEGSFTLGMHVECPAVESTGVVLAAFGPSDYARIRVPASDQIDVAGTLTSDAGTITTAGGRFHVALVYDATRGRADFYVDGALVSSQSVTAGLSWPSIALGSPDTAHHSVGEHATGYRLRNVTLHATALGVLDVARLAAGELPMVSLQVACPLTDGVGRRATAILANAFGKSTTVTATQRLDTTAPTWAPTLTPVAVDTTVTITADELASDESGYVDYQVAIDGSTWVDIVPRGAAFTVHGLTAYTTYSSAKLRARDLATNATEVAVPEFNTGVADATTAFTTFSGETAGAIPSEWSNFGDSGWTVAVVNDAGATDGKVVRLTVPSTAGNYALAWDNIPTDADQMEIVARFRRCSGSTGSLPLRSMMSGSPLTACNANVDSNGTALHRVLSGANSVLTGYDTTIKLTTGAWYWVRLRYASGTLSVRAWADGASEPGKWQKTASIGTVTGGGGLGGRYGAAVFDFDLVGASWDGTTAPTS